MQLNSIYIPADAECAGLQEAPSENYRGAEDFAAIPGELKRRRQWINWKIGQIKANGKFKKLPIDLETGITMNADHPGNWQTFEGRWRTAALAWATELDTSSPRMIGTRALIWMDRETGIRAISRRRPKRS